MDNNHPQAGGYRSQPQAQDDGAYDSDRRSIFETDNENSNEIVTHAPRERFRLGYFDVISLVLNRMIGK